MHPISKRQIRRLRHKHPRMAQLLQFIKRRKCCHCFIYRDGDELYVRSYKMMLFRLYGGLGARFLRY
jgi:hypothetical protein